MKEVSHEDLSNYERMRVRYGARVLHDAIRFLQNTNNMRIVFREELASISEALASIEEKTGEEVR